MIFVIFDDFSCFLMILGVCIGVVVVVAAGTIGRGPLDHRASSAPVSRLPGTRKAIIRDKLCENLKVTLMGELRTLLRARKGKRSRNLTSKISKSQIFDFPKLAPERSWGIAGMVGRAETRSKHTAARPRASRPASSPA